MDPLFTIITVCYNSEKTIERTIQSVLNQTNKDYEYLIIDGASTDGTLDIVRKYKARFDGRLKLISEKDNGIYDAMNKGIQKASGTLIGIVNSDDYLEEDALDNIANAYDGYDYEILYGMLRTVRNGQEVQVYIKNHELIDEDMIAHPSCFVTKKIYDAFGMYSLDYKYSADYEFMLRMSRNPEVKFKEVYKIISNFSIDGASSSVRGYMDTLRLKKEYGLIGSGKYRREMLKCKLSLILKG
ncbi:glycosyltransferase family 2 protein [Butyrivibrio proteoclasticus]|uniref:glycosyltransferase family 2 protein n=1 Tax=Butyrivibrio proteoclasticus TaxID=43305 RepID=UPI000558EE41|nr:glycosyltransferase family 2 protein [Butyrivibrio proteoclasticus]